MLRGLGLLAAIALTGGVVAAPAVAQPAPAPCAYVLSPPRLVDVDGTTMVTATVDTGACDGAVTYQTMVCLQPTGGTGPGQCAQGRGILPAQVFAPHRAGTSYTATGRGCALRGNPPQSFCVEPQPSTVTL
ncbi:hypothetical protein ACAG25_12960 [Mycobacterium sp. pV006]|uniref:hypothetical protein n=1 Tax=Mycobacterium sp. pV006 TaxID=3238983 RepID=UPI00351BD903